MFTLTDGRRAYLPLPVAERIEKELRIGRDTPFQICRLESGSGKQKRVTYDVQRVEAGTATVVRTENTDAALRHFPALPSTSRVVAAPQSDLVVQEAQQTTSSRKPSAMREYSASAKKMMVAFADAIDVACEVEKYAERRSYTLEFTVEDIRSIAATLFIQNAKEIR